MVRANNDLLLRLGRLFQFRIETPLILTFPFKGQHAAQRLVAAKANIRIANVMP